MKIHLFTTTWQQDSARLGALRQEVFVIEQKVPEELEWDEHDAAAVHFACEDILQATIIGTARLVVDLGANKATMGRLCVSKKFRHQKVATQLMQKILSYCAEQRFSGLELHAQQYLKAFYESFGFIAQGGIYSEAGIEHITMVRG